MLDLNELNEERYNEIMNDSDLLVRIKERDLAGNEKVLHDVMMHDEFYDANEITFKEEYRCVDYNFLERVLRVEGGYSFPTSFGVTCIVERID